MKSNIVAKISATGSAFPEKIVTNQDLVEKLAKLGVETNDDWIRERTGIEERRISDLSNPEERNSSLAARAARQALERSEVNPEEIDQIIFATCSPDTLVPSAACWLQQKIGAKKAWAYDVNAACSGFAYGLTIANQAIQSGAAKHILVIGSEVLSPFLNWHDRSICILFGDGAGAAVVSATDPSDESQILSSHLESDGGGWELFYTPAGGSNMEVTPQVYEQHLHKMTMKGREVFKFATRTLSEFALRAIRHHDIQMKDVDWFIPHQANLRIIEAVAKRLEVPMEQVIVNVNQFGNTSSATVPTALDQAVTSKKINKGDLVLLDVFGAGLTYGSVLLRF